MTKISRINIDPKHFGFFLNNFWNLVTLLENKEQVRDFLKDLLTHTEMKMFAKRIQIAKMLIEGHNYRAIRNYVKVTDTTIAKINNLLASGGDGLRNAIHYLHKMEKDIDKNRMSIEPDLKSRYPTYFLPEIIMDEVGKQFKKRKRKNSIRQSL